MPRRKTIAERRSKAGRKADTLDVALDKQAVPSRNADDPLTPAQEMAAQMVAEGRYDYTEIAAKVGVDRLTLYRWRQNATFSARVSTISREFSEAVLRRGLARKDYRLDTLANLHSRLLTVIEERGADPSMADIPGGKTGLIVRSTVASAGEMIGYEYAVDTATIRELRGIQEQAAKELGQLVDKHEVRFPPLRDMSNEQLEQLYAEVCEPLCLADGNQG